MEPELKTAIEAQGRAWDEFKKTNDARLSAIEKGLSTADFDTKLAKINTDMAEITKGVKLLEAKSNRPQILGADGKTLLTDDQIAHKAAFHKFLRKGEEAGLREIERKAMNSQSDPDGGYLVLPEIDKSIDRFAGVMSAMYRLANVVTIGAIRWEKRVKTSGMSMRRVADGATSGETTEPKFSNVAIEAYTAEIEPWVNNETLDDAYYDLEGDLATEAGISFAEGAGAEFITGNGVGKAFGITTGYTVVANGSYAWGKLGYIPSGGAGAFAASNPADAIVNLIHSLKAQYRPGAAMLMADATLGTLRQMKDASGQYYLWNPNPLGGFGGVVLGVPVEIDDNMPVIASNSYSIAYGNFKRGYTIVRRAGTSLIRDNVTQKGVTKFNFRQRFGGGVSHYEAIKLLKFSTS
jgi:HK97 family phage major capsid protein